MKKRSSKLKKILVAVLILAALIGGMFGARAYISSGKTAAVIPISMIADTWIEDSSAGYGQVSQGGIQYIYPDTSMLIQKVYVSPGDVVNKGDPLIQYDATQAALQVDSYRIQYEMAKKNLQEARETLAYYKTFKPYQEPKPVQMKFGKIVKLKTEEEINWKQLSYIKIKEEEYVVIDLDLDTPIRKSVFEYLFGVKEKELHQLVEAENNSSSAEIQQSDDSEKELSNEKGISIKHRFIFNIWKTAAGYDSVRIATIKSHKNYHPSELLAWFQSGFKNDDKVYRFSEVFSYDELSGYIENQFDNSFESNLMYLTDFNPSAIPEPVIPPEEESHTQEEIDEMILNQTQTIRRMEVSVAQAELAWKRAKQTATDGVVRAYDAGTVTSVGDPFAVSGDEPFITVQSGHGYEVTSTISELQLGTVKVGDQVSIQMWSNGMTYTGTITKISPYPTTNNMSYYGGGGGNVSYYEYTAELDCEDELQPWDGGEIRFVTDSSSSKAEFALQTCYVREENGRSYVLKAGDDDRLVKQYVEVGRLLYGGYSVEILGGLSLEDSIAFPYGKSAVEGAKVDRESGMGGMYW